MTRERRLRARGNRRDAIDGADRSAIDARTRQETNRDVVALATLQPRAFIALQRRLGNAYTQRLARAIGDGTQDEAGELAVKEEFEPSEGGEVPHVCGPAPPREEDSAARDEGGFADSGRTGTVAVGDPVGAEAQGKPQAFVNAGRTGTAIWAGGGGAGPRGNEFTGSLQTHVAPTYIARPGPAKGKFSARVQGGTGKIKVKRSWLGARAGNQGNGQYVTRRAAGRFDEHERKHVRKTREHYNTHIGPLLRDAASRSLGRNAGSSAAEAITVFTAALNWATRVTAFQTADTTDNTPMGTVDTADLASGTYPVDAGPGTVRGVAFTNRIRVPSEANPPA